MTSLTHRWGSSGNAPMLKGEPDLDRPGETVETRTVIDYILPDQSLAAGYWESEVGRYRSVSDRWECFTVLSGRCTVTPDDGEPATYGPGDSGIIEKGFRGIWHITEAMCKSWVVRL
jgi:uncharacterized cupin superfamily protein